MSSNAAPASAHPLADPVHRRFLLRKLHSLSGVVPVGVFLVFHLWTNAKAISGQGPFDLAVAEINGMPYLPILEATILVPLAFHALYGMKLAFEARPNPGLYPYARNWLYVLQRVSGVIALAFIAVHLWELWFQKTSGRLEPSAFYPTLSAHLSSTTAGIPLVAIGYLVGIAASVFHFANGMWGFGMAWGITLTRRSQRLAGWIFAIVGVIVFFLGANTTLYFATGSKLFVPGSHHGEGLRPPRPVE